MTLRDRFGKLTQLNVWQKLILIVLPFLIPIVVLAYLLTGYDREQIDFTEKEQTGLEYLKPVREMVRLVQQHRGLSAAVLAGNATFRAEQLKQRASVDKEIAAIDALDAKYGTALKTTEKWQAVRASWRQLQADTDALTPQASFERHSTVVSDLLALSLEVWEHSNLALDPEGGSYFVQDAMIARLLPTTESLGQCRAVGSSSLTRIAKAKEQNKTAALSNEERSQLAALLATSQRLRGVVQDNYARAFRQDTTLQPKLDGKVQDFLIAVDQFNSFATTKVTNSQEVTVTTADWFAAATRTIDAGFDLYDASEPVLSKSLTTRISKHRRQLWLTSGLVLGGVFIVAVLTFFVARGILRQVNGIQELFSQIGIGNFQARAPVTSTDELGVMTASLNAMLDNTLALIETSDEKEQMQTAVMKLLEEVAGVADGDLTKHAEVTADMTGAIADSFNHMIEQLRKIIGDVQHTAVQVSTSATQIQATAESLAGGAEAQSAQILSTSAAIDEMAVSIQQVSDNSQVAAGVAKDALANATKGNDAVRNTMEGMSRIRDQVQETAKRIKRLGETTQEIGQIIQLIDDIADRTSILALNASIQAASAGEAGRGFAVVAGEVERLAERSTEATKKIATLVKSIQSETNEAVAAMEKSINEVVSGSKLANQAGTSLQEIQSVSTQLAELIQSISLAAHQQARGSEALAASMTEISTITQQTASGTRQANESVGELADLADTLRDSVSAFRLPGDGGNGHNGNGHNGNGHNGNGHNGRQKAANGRIPVGAL